MVPGLPLKASFAENGDCKLKKQRYCYLENARFLHCVDGQFASPGFWSPSQIASNGQILKNGKFGFGS